ncbi:phage tail assembly protein [Acetobacter lambici]|uniref:Phage tail assembly protein n=1 Tax=Acetobacter lambici TaxID=1332824 RepID=A0ABT1EZD3_9PROT|nr:phage tail assembly protein [Acetobacter lambici]MCP1258310.1 phage tail assembly protein [Acetobacter lambici]
MSALTDAEVLCAVAVQDDAEQVEDGVFYPDNTITTKDGAEWKELRLREPTVFHSLSAARVIGKKPSIESIYDSQIDLVCRLSGWPKMATGQLPTRILDKAVAYASAFEENARRKQDEEPECLESLILLFTPPIEAVNQSFSEMVLREPVVSERRKYKATESRGSFADFLQAEIDLVSAISGWPMAAVLKMPISKFAKGADYLTGFFMTGHQTGNPSQPI